MSAFAGGSSGRFQHPLNPAFIFTEGTKAALEVANAQWLLDLIALEMAPLYARAWMSGEASVALVRVAVSTVRAARLELIVADEGPPAFVKTLAFVDLPEGEWQFFLATDEVDDEICVTTCMVPPEY